MSDTTNGTNPYLINSPNYTQIPNVIIDHWMAFLSPAEFKVLICICRKTFGWKKENDRISLRQIETMTGLSRKGIITNLESLVEKELVTKVKSKTSDGDDAPNRYEINVNCVGVGSEENSPRVGQSVHHGVVNSVHPQKKDYTKERLTKESISCAQGALPTPPLNSPVSKKEETKPQKIAYRTNVQMTKDDYDKLKAEYGETKLTEMIEILDTYKGSTGKRYKSDYYVLLPKGWVHERYLKEKNQHSDSVIAKHRQGSKLAIETEVTTWEPLSHEEYMKKLEIEKRR